MLLLMLAACPSRDISKLDPLPAKEVYKEIPFTSNRKIDILFVVDNSDSMREEQVNLANNFPRFIEVLDGIEGGRPSVHLGVISSDMGIFPYGAEACSGRGDDGKLQNTPRLPGCTPPNGGARFIEDVELPGGGRQTNYTGNLEDVFSCIAQLGNLGCGLEQHYAAMKKALDPGPDGTPENAGFIRDGAYLAIIVLADEDDCSPSNGVIFDPARDKDNIASEYGVFSSFRCTEFGVTCDGGTIARAAADYNNCEPRGDSPFLYHPQVYVNFLRQLKGDPNLLIAAAIVGNPSPFGVFINTQGAPQLKNSCITTNLGKADPGVRHKWFVDQFGTQGKFVSICQENLYEALDEVAKLLAKAIGTPCLDDEVQPVDIDPVEAGLQLECLVYDKNTGPGGEPIETVIPRCDMVDANTPSSTGRPCWWTNVDAAACPTSLTGLTLHVERAADPPATTRIVARCIAD